MAGLPTSTVNGLFLDALQGQVVRHSDVQTKPLEIDLVPGFHPEMIRLYLFTLSNPPGGRGYNNNDTEYKITVKMPQHNEDRGSDYDFDFSGKRTPIIAGVEEKSIVFVMWDAMGYQGIPYNRNLQIRGSTIIEAVARGIGLQIRSLRKTHRKEVIIACSHSYLIPALWARAIISSSAPQDESSAHRIVDIAKKRSTTFGERQQEWDRFVI